MACLLLPTGASPNYFLLHFATQRSGSSSPPSIGNAEDDVGYTKMSNRPLTLTALQRQPGGGANYDLGSHVLRTGESS